MIKTIEYVIMFLLLQHFTHTVYQSF